MPQITYYRAYANYDNTSDLRANSKCYYEERHQDQGQAECQNINQGEFQELPQSSSASSFCKGNSSMGEVSINRTDYLSNSHGPYVSKVRSLKRGENQLKR